MLHTPTQADLIEAYNVRMMIDGYCAEVVARHYPDAAARAAIDRMEDALSQQQRLMEDDSAYSLSQFWLDDLSFHKALLEYMNISSMNAQYDRFMHIFMPQHLVEDEAAGGMHPRALDRHRTTLVEHAEITEALKSHDLERVRQSIRKHLDSSLKALYVRLED